MLDLLDDPEWPRQTIKKRLAEIERERTKVQAELADTTSRLQEGQQFFGLALDLLADPQGFYRRGNEGVKRAMTKVIFSKLHVDAEMIAGHDLTDGIAGLIEVGASEVTKDKSDSLPEEGAALDRMTDADLLDVILADHGSSKAAMVEVPGIEPGSSAALRGLLRAQFTLPLLGPIGHVNKPV